MAVAAPGGTDSELRISLIGGLMIGLGPVSVSIYAPALPQITADLGTSADVISLSITLFFAGFAVFQLVCGTLSDSLGRKPVALAFFALYFLATLAALVAVNPEMLLAARFFQGIGAAVGVAVTRAIVRDLFDGETSVRVLSLMATVIAIGPTLAPSIGGVIVEFLNWRAIFVLLAVWSLVVIFAIGFGLRETRPPRPGQLRLGPLWRSARRLVTDWRYMVPTLGVAGVGGTMYALASVLPFLIIGEIGLSPTGYGLWMIFQSGMYMTGSIVARTLSRFWAPRRLAAMGVGFALVGTLGLAVQLLGPRPSVITVMAPIALVAFGSAHMLPALMTAAMRGFPEDAGMASSILGFSQMATGFLVGSAAGLLHQPMVAIFTIIPLGYGVGCLCTFLWLRARRGD
ncbi:multidrug effflux MFS transporter [Acuticoccus mangrovi]|uniref:Bcr/CflA family efflux transporter n=1 Tax=Acuticoccus mangrovi TaxID=2796142 RepID=A0A934II03_9HYPH|nr:multidrug effflux MFS transporter [Acuticoccus mangrovi]MBJ3775351.1 multidrug effflux MFS transporter [Acuticoccus mangrovi]